MVCKAINNIDCNKAPGSDRLTIEHIVHAHPSIVNILTKLFNIMLQIGMVPDDFGQGVITPVPKFKINKEAVTADDFRGITICQIISKMFEHCILLYLNKLTTADRQFGFKKNVECNNSLHAVLKAINFFNNRKSTVSIGVFDLKKAFDRCNTFGILCMLQDKLVNISIINIIENWCSKNYTSLKWGNAISHKVPLLCGVKQGGFYHPFYLRFL